MPAAMPEFDSAAALEAWGRGLAVELPRFAVLVLEGPLGAGKTTLMKGLAAGWGVANPEQVTSPTYTLIHEYHRGERSLYHLDLYRIETGAQLDTLGLEDLWQPPPAPEARLIAIEWGEKIAAHLPRPYLHVRLAIPTPDRRELQAGWRR